MRIDGYSHIQQPDTSSPAVRKSETTRVTNASDSKLITAYASASGTTGLLDGSYELKHERVQELKQQIASGTYALNVAGIADSMLNSVFASR